MNLKAQLGELQEIRGQNLEPKVQTSPKQDGLENIALLRIYLKSRIKEYESYENTYNRAMESLTNEERDYLETMYRGHYFHPVYTLCEKYHIEKTHVYRKKDKALKKFSKLVSGI